jgi:hypothetical protein
MSYILIINPNSSEACSSEIAAAIAPFRVAWGPGRGTGQAKHCLAQASQRRRPAVRPGVPYWPQPPAEADRGPQPAH